MYYFGLYQTKVIVQTCLSVGENTETACEGEELEITCDDGYINIVSALYGRVEEDICASDGQVRLSIRLSIVCFQYNILSQPRDWEAPFF